MKESIRTIGTVTITVVLLTIGFMAGRQTMTMDSHMGLELPFKDAAKQMNKSG